MSGENKVAPEIGLKLFALIQFFKSSEQLSFHFLNLDFSIMFRFIQFFKLLDKPDFNSLFNQLTKEAKSIYFNTNEHYRANIETQTREDRFIEWAKKKYPTHQHEKSNFILQRLRSLKHKEEICQIQQAINITEKGFRRVLDFVRPGVWEYEIEAEFVNEFIKKISVVTLSKLGVEKIGNHAITLSEFEQLNGHTQSIKSRIRR